MKPNEKLIDTLLEIFNHIINFDASTDYGKWYIGISNNPDQTLIKTKVMENIHHFKSWNLDNNLSASTIKNYLIEKGCKEGEAEIFFKTTHLYSLKEATFIYIYKKG